MNTHTQDAHYATQTQSKAPAKLVPSARKMGIEVGRRLGRRNGGVWVTKAAFKKLLTKVSLVILGEKSQTSNSDYGILSHDRVSAQRQQDLHHRPRGVLHPRVCEFLVPSSSCQSSPLLIV